MSTILIPSFFVSHLNASEIASTANLLAAYHPPPGIDVNPAADEILTILPEQFFRIIGKIALIIAANPKTFVSNCARAFSSEVSSIVPNCPKPALLTRTSMLISLLTRCVTKLLISC